MNATISHGSTARGVAPTCALLSFSLVVSTAHPNSGSSETAAVSFQQDALGVFDDLSTGDVDAIDQRWPRPDAFVPQPIFFPPSPPPLGAVPAWPQGMRFEMGAPHALEQLVAEPFYAPLSPKLALRRFKGRQRAWLERYVVVRSDLRAELLHALRMVDGAEPARRREMLMELAKAQTPRIAELEAEAESFRAGLVRRLPFADGAGSWNGLRRWRLGRGRLNRPREDNAVFEYMVVRAAAYFHEGLSPAQRRLLREAAIEMEEEILPANRGGSAGPTLTFFSPETSRVRLPADLPARVADLVCAYESEKSTLKAELRDAIYELDDAMIPGARTRALRALSASQTPRIEKLETAAEEIRLALSQISDLPRLARPSGDGEFVVAASDETVVLNTGAERLHEALFEYDLAVFEPGLSPEQRRLLFGSALEKMNLPLPGGELQPVDLPGTIVMN